MKSDLEEDKITEADRIIDCLRKTKKERDREELQEALRKMIFELSKLDLHTTYNNRNDIIDAYINICLVPERIDTGTCTITKTKSRTNTQRYSGEYYLFDIETSSGSRQQFNNLLGGKT